ncbi:MAG: glycine C-acetyltransferase [Oligoflexales bacterium]|nr:glycine C-acetyltransferase [Oligoflexales bacterium]
MNSPFLTHLQKEIEILRSEGLYKKERVLQSPQRSLIESNGQKVINLCSNNYLGLCDDKELITTARSALETYGFGLSSVRFICGTQTIHKELEAHLSSFLHTEDCILYSSCFDANGGVFEALLGPEDAVISDELNHASIIDGIRLSKAHRYRYKNNDLNDLEKQLEQATAAKARFKLVCTDGVFSMDGLIANLKEVRKLADKYGALLMVDDSHAVGFMGASGRGTPEHCDVLGKIDIITGTLGKALGGASGGYVAAKKEIVEWLRQKSRPYLFSNTLAPVITATSLKVLELVDQRPELRKKLKENSSYFRASMQELGFKLIPGEHPIIPVMLGDAVLAQKTAEALLKEGVYVVGFSFPVVPRGQARIRTQMSAAHSRADLDHAIRAFEKVGRELKIL